MGDSRRFVKFAKYIATKYPDRNTKILDVAGGKGYLKSELYRLGYNNVTTMDKRKRNAKPREGYKYGYFKGDIEPGEWELIVAMHPDEASEEIIDYCFRNKCDYIIVPCCVLPSITQFKGDYNQWYNHLWDFSNSKGLLTYSDRLSIIGKNMLLWGKQWP